MATDTTTYRGENLTIHEGQFANCRVCWAVSGVGRVAASRAARLLCAGHRPNWLLSVGFAGGLNKNLTAGQPIIPTRVVDARFPKKLPYAADASVTSELWKQIPPTNQTLVTVDEIASDPALKAAVREATSADLLDMEAASVAAVASENELPFLTVRVISDTATDSLPPEVAHLSQPQSSLHRFGAALSAVVRRPSAAIDFWNLWEKGLLHSRTLAAALHIVAGVIMVSQQTKNK